MTKRKQMLYNIFMLVWWFPYIQGLDFLHILATSALSGTGTVAHPLHWFYIECYKKTGMVQASSAFKFLALCMYVHCAIIWSEWISYNVKLLLRCSHFGKKCCRTNRRIDGKIITSKNPLAFARNLKNSNFGTTRLYKLEKISRYAKGQ